MTKTQLKLTKSDLRKAREFIRLNTSARELRRIYFQNDALFSRFNEWRTLYDWNLNLNTNRETLFHDWFLSDSYQIFPRAPFYRERKDVVAVLGIESGVWLYNTTSHRGYCNALNCNKPVTFITQKPIGHVFFFDIDELISTKELHTILETVMYEYDISHFVMTQTNKGYHVWSTEIRPQKVGWYQVFRNLKNVLASDYEFNAQWILRIGSKGSSPPPDVIGFLENEEISNIQISLGHIAILKNYGNMPKIEQELRLEENNHILLNTYARLVQYKSWDVDKID